MSDAVGKWAAGTHYGPVLTQTDLYLLNTDLQLNPILTNSNSDFHLVFNVSTGQTGGFNPDARDRDLPFTAKDEPATLPRVTELILISNLTPWCTIVKNERGVTLSDVCTTIWKDYTENFVTDGEYAALPPRLQEHVRRTAAHNQGGWSGFYTPAPQVNRFKRVDWLRERVYFEGLDRNDNYAVQRLGFKAPNIFVMQFVS
ncbi:hypothetical protein PUNSTDRAFT_121105 [Punctularia strigosozonata HHB-11173 SS5]|uniref:uncharacterized protein n=1 Tax=Punctularia strigosozonata (strain HHB-11173) TaxID=741275 RepID=UPI000441723E|nr:uncharacterized protein PUNSTDRAFT_121105 [Punctularia strigosozonata HHB-11173 SS5]EIN07931.1 hypothetical protein PUNSTDRAFT_121105 [Punctularia strigosozonata HHB-11173 SS5]